MIFINQRVEYQCCIKNQKNCVTRVSIISPFVGRPISISFLDAGSLQEQVPVSTAILVDKCCQFFSSFNSLQLAPVIMLVRHLRQSTSVLKDPLLIFVQKIMFVDIPYMYLTFSSRYFLYLPSCVNKTFTNIFLDRPHAT